MPPTRFLICLVHRGTFACAAFLSVLNGALAVPLYTNDFSAPVGTEWSHTQRETSPSGVTFLGRFGHETVKLALPDAPLGYSGFQVDVSVHMIHTWDGSVSNLGPDGFAIRYGDGGSMTDYLSHTFSNWGHHLQTFGGQNAPAGLYPRFTGASAVDVLQIPWHNGDPEHDSRYYFSFVFPALTGAQPDSCS